MPGYNNTYFVELLWDLIYAKCPVRALNELSRVISNIIANEGWEDKQYVIQRCLEERASQGLEPSRLQRERCQSVVLRWDLKSCEDLGTCACVLGGVVNAKQWG